MTKPPNLNYQAVSGDEMNRLVRDNSIEARLPACTQQRFRQQQDSNHEQFCCKKDAVLFVDPDTSEEVAIVIEQIHADPAKGITRTYTGLRIGNDVYRLRIP
jgi:hypothetical protein